jgi:glycosyltransferase involved in cell wall biosynthesis
MATCRLLFVGAYWHRKGADVAVSIARALNASGVPTELHLAGSAPPGPLPAFVTVHRFLSKADAEGKERLEHLFRAAHFLVVPSRADCSPIVVAEASAYGVPSIGTNVGGMATMIRDRLNGQTFALGALAEEYAAYVARLMSAQADYQALALSALREYQQRLNWASAAGTAANLIRQFCGAGKHDNVRR